MARDSGRRALAARCWPLFCGLFAAFLLPFARDLQVQVSVPLMIWLLWLVAKDVSTGTPMLRSESGVPGAMPPTDRSW